MSFYGKPYVSVAKRQAKAQAAAKKAAKSGVSLSPIEAHRGATAKTFWGKAWCENLEAYSDYENRLPRGRTYVRNGSVIDLKMVGAQVNAQVMGSSLYKVVVSVKPVPQNQWQSIGKSCSGSIDSLVELLQGKLSTGVMQCICAPKTGLFPSPTELSFDCTCPDWAGMCKHVAAVMYGVGARLDQQPELLFALRGVDAKDLVSQAGMGMGHAGADLAKSRVLDNAALADVFGFELAEAEVADSVKPAAAKKASGKTAAAKKTVVKKLVAKKVAAKKPASKTIAPAVKNVRASKAPSPAAKPDPKPKRKAKTVAL